MDRHLTWSLLKLLSQKCSLPWLLGGDFNEILSACEKDGGLPRCRRQMDDFKEVVEYCRVKSLHSHGPKFTWRGVRSGEEVAVRLDRVLASSDWTDIFHTSHALNLMPSKSDHLPILIKVREFRPKKKRKKKRFRFEEGWLLGEDCQKMVELGWNVASGGDPFSRICNNYKTQEMFYRSGVALFLGTSRRISRRLDISLLTFFILLSRPHLWWTVWPLKQS